MASSKTVTSACDGETVEITHVFDSSGWTFTSGELPISKFRGRRSHAPENLSVGDQIGASGRVSIQVNLPISTSETELGPSGNATKPAEPVDGKLLTLTPKSHSEKSSASSSDSEDSRISRFSEEHEFLAALDDLEAARSEESESESQPVPRDRSGIWGEPVVSAASQSKQYEDWIDEADDLEANASLPEGTRFYRASSQAK